MTYDDYLWDRSGDPDPGLKKLEDLLRDYKYRRPRRPIWRHPVVVTIIPMAVAAILILSFVIDRPIESIRTEPWVVSTTLGAPTVDGARITGGVHVNAGQWLCTDDVSRMRLSLGSAGEIFAEPGTELQVTSTSAGAPHVTLKRGMLHVALWSDADVTINTPSGDAVDRNDEFVLAVDESGHACLSVNSGGVSLRRQGHESVVPAGAVCEAFPDQGLGTPYCETAPDRFRRALEYYDFSDQGQGALTAVLNEAGPCDLVPLWHLLRRSTPGNRGQIYDHMAGFETPPPSVTREGILRLESSMMQRWWEQISAHQSCMMCSESHQIGVS